MTLVPQADIFIGGRLNGKTELIRKRAELVYRATELVKEAEYLGVVLTIEQKPVLPLAMGNYETLVSIRPVRS